MPDDAPVRDLPTIDPASIGDLPTVAPAPAVDPPTVDVPVRDLTTIDDGGPTRNPALAANSPAGFELIGELGRGGMGVVYRARDTDLNREVAVKVLAADVSAGSSVATRFHDEARITGQLQHPGIPPVYRIGRLLIAADWHPLQPPKEVHDASPEKR